MEQIRKIMEENRRLTIHELANKVRIGLRNLPRNFEGEFEHTLMQSLFQHS